GVDDGSRTMEQSLRVLRRFAGAGVTCVVCTPHLVASEADRVPVDRFVRVHRALCEQLEPGMTVQRGWEIMLDRPNVDLTSPVLRLGASNAILVEFPRGVLPSGTELELARLRQSGVLPVVAHPERYGGASLDLVQQWRTAGAVIQTDTAYLLGDGGRCDLARGMLAAGLIDILSSDNHGDDRTLAGARDWLVEIGATDAALLLTAVNPGSLLSDQQLVPVPPVKMETGMFARLRELLGRRRGTPLRNTPIA
ncbi:MAG TPA: CpsB/CapC family capsule biosynthesis tyrosine phosphatase, partial [Gemmatimonadaceae bacterium]|nr:CpsB/CapC family capsule biosynthesis tyrosine phosphatase [Gemmatimonadaceae bacterium]